MAERRETLTTIEMLDSRENERIWPAWRELVGVTNQPLGVGADFILEGLSHLIHVAGMVRRCR